MNRKNRKRDDESNYSPNSTFEAINFRGVWLSFLFWAWIENRQNNCVSKALHTMTVYIFFRSFARFQDIRLLFSLLASVFLSVGLSNEVSNVNAADFYPEYAIDFRYGNGTEIETPLTACFIDDCIIFINKTPSFYAFAICKLAKCNYEFKYRHNV